MSPVVTLPHIYRNIPLSRRHLKAFPPKQYPLCLNIIFNRHYVEFQKHLKAILDTIPKREIKYRSNKYIATTFNCYCHSLESLSPILNDALGHTQMYQRFGLIPDKRIYLDDLWKQGQAALAKT